MARGVLGFSGAALRKALADEGITSDQLAAEIHVSPATVRRWENGTSLPTVHHLTALANALVRPSGDFVPASLSLRSVRQLAGLTLHTAAVKTQIARSTIHRLEQGSADTATDPTITALAGVYGVTENELRQAIDTARTARDREAQARRTARRAR